MKRKYTALILCAALICIVLSACFGESIATVKNASFSFKAEANTAAAELNELCESYISSGIPVITWVTISMLDTYPAEKWRLENRKDFYWPANEHCMLLIGYDGESCYFNDPYVGKTVKYSKELAEKRYDELGKQAVVIANKVN